MILNAFPGGEAPAALPKFTYTGNYFLIDDGESNWRIKFLTSGTLIFLKSPGSMDLFLCGGGGGTFRNGGYSGGAGGGYTHTQTAISISANTEFSIAIGAGGVAASDGGSTAAFGYSAAGGKLSNTYLYGGNGGSGGATYNGTGGVNGNDGTGTDDQPGTGQHTTTREFAEATGALYGGGGSGIGIIGGGTNGGQNGAANTGNGAGADNGVARNGGSGIAVIRNHRA